MRGVDRLRALDARITREARTHLSLAPDAPAPTPFAVLAERLQARAADRGADGPGALAAGLRRLGEGTLLHYPENLFWDFDHLAAALLREAEDAAGLRASFDLVVALFARFGRRTPIRFRYLHDFLYGFDWAKWVAAEPAPRAAIGPFDRAFLRRLHGRGEELLRLIDRDDATYPQLEGRGSRNPFPFSRDPDEEAPLHRELARAGLVPVEAWRLDARPRWDLPFAEEREARARALSPRRAPPERGDGAPGRSPS
ncbi:MAG: ferrochelatase [Sandaracinaceae bacterium]